MSNKVKILLAVVVAAIVLAIGGGVAVMADEGQTTQSNPLFAKVAAVLGNVTEQQLTDAFKQAREQVASTEIETRLARALADGIITQTEKTAIETWLAQKPDYTDKEAMKAWLKAQPEISKPEFLKRLLGAPGLIKRYHYCIGVPFIGGEAVMEKAAAILHIDVATLKSAFQLAGKQLQDGNIVKALNQAVANGKLTQAEADQISSWWAERPAAIDKLMPDFRPGGYRGPVQQFHPQVQCQGCR
jgi:hypothetical protein